MLPFPNTVCLLDFLSFLKETTLISLWSVRGARLIPNACWLFPTSWWHLLNLREIHECSGKTLQRDVEEMPERIVINYGIFPDLKLLT